MRSTNVLRFLVWLWIFWKVDGQLTVCNIPLPASSSIYTTRSSSNPTRPTTLTSTSLTSRLTSTRPTFLPISTTLSSSTTRTTINTHYSTTTTEQHYTTTEEQRFTTEHPTTGHYTSEPQHSTNEHHITTSERTTNERGAFKLVSDQETQHGTGHIYDDPSILDQETSDEDHKANSPIYDQVPDEPPLDQPQISSTTFHEKLSHLKKLPPKIKVMANRLYLSNNLQSPTSPNTEASYEIPTKTSAEFRSPRLISTPSGPRSGRLETMSSLPSTIRRDLEQHIDEVAEWIGGYPTSSSTAQSDEWFERIKKENEELVVSQGAAKLDLREEETKF